VGQAGQRYEEYAPAPAFFKFHLARGRTNLALGGKAERNEVTYETLEVGGPP
jgi:hypothetical protein